MAQEGGLRIWGACAPETLQCLVRPPAARPAHLLQQECHATEPAPVTRMWL